MDNDTHTPITLKALAPAVDREVLLPDGGVSNWQAREASFGPTRVIVVGSLLATLEDRASEPAKG